MPNNTDFGAKVYYWKEKNWRINQEKTPWTQDWDHPIIVHLCAQDQTQGHWWEAQIMTTAPTWLSCNLFWNFNRPFAGPGHVTYLRNIKRICMGKSCWLASLAHQQLFPIQIFLPFPIFKLLPNFIFQCYRPQAWQFYLVFPALFISGTHKVPGLKSNGG